MKKLILAALIVLAVGTGNVWAYISEDGWPTADRIDYQGIYNLVNYIGYNLPPPPPACVQTIPADEVAPDGSFIPDSFDGAGGGGGGGGGNDAMIEMF